ncbi:hypothetical protein [Rhodopirellula sp. MGV]|uniref:hypothetical protein n=1 Tax=Rhodopirellula sp. MGV TaxID=2023130 RepID=UPI00117A94F3|nr:hypothetical protein [Rhodopirellula sp. MGV]
MTARIALGIGSLVVCIPMLSGCRGRAQDDYYRQKLTNQIRVLEDQLYDADYQNRVLRDKLEQAREVQSDEPDGQGDDPYLAPKPLEDYDVMDLDPSPSDIQSEEPRDDFTPPSLPVPPVDFPDDSSVLEPPADKPLEAPPLRDPDPMPVETPGEPTDVAPGIDSDLGMPEDLPLPVPDPDNNSQLLPAPKSPGEQLLPPSDDQLQDDQIIPGDPQPPAGNPSNPPGRITLPPNLERMSYETTVDASPSAVPIPDHLEIHPQLSGAHRPNDDEPTDGLYLVVTAVDKAGDILALANYDIDAKLTVVAIDPLDESEDPRVGRWDFTPEEVRSFIQQNPVDGFHLSLKWQDRIPDGEEVIVHLRLKAADEEMRCQASLRLNDAVAVSSWLPRG